MHISKNGIFVVSMIRPSVRFFERTFESIFPRLLSFTSPRVSFQVRSGPVRSLGNNTSGKKWDESSFEKLGRRLVDVRH